MLWRIPFRSYLIPLAMGILYLFIGYFTTREQSVQFLVLSFGLFGLTYFSVQKYPSIKFYGRVSFTGQSCLSLSHGCLKISIVSFGMVSYFLTS